MQDIGFDVISDLNLSPNDNFNWENKPTSLYCIVAGNISSDLRTIIQTLLHLSRLYHGVFFVPGRLEYESSQSFVKRTIELESIAQGVPNLVMLHHNVAVVDGVAVLGSNGWGNIENSITTENLMMNSSRYDDFTYLTKTLTRLQRHLDVKKIIVVTSAVPHEDLYFGEKPENVEDQIPLYDILETDTEKKVTHWVFGTYNKPVDTYLNYINFVSNPKNQYGIYHAKRLTISI